MLLSKANVNVKELMSQSEAGIGFDRRATYPLPILHRLHLAFAVS